MPRPEILLMRSIIERAQRQLEASYVVHRYDTRFGIQLFNAGGTERGKLALISPSGISSNVRDSREPGRKRTDDGKLQAPDVKKGDTVLIGKYSGDTAEVKAPGGIKEYEILDVKYV